MLPVPQSTMPRLRWTPHSAGLDLGWYQTPKTRNPGPRKPRFNVARAEGPYVPRCAQAFARPADSSSPSAVGDIGKGSGGLTVGGPPACIAYGTGGGTVRPSLRSGFRPSCGLEPPAVGFGIRLGMYGSVRGRAWVSRRTAFFSARRSLGSTEVRAGWCQGWCQRWGPPRESVHGGAVPDQVSSRIDPACSAPLQLQISTQHFARAQRLTSGFARPRPPRSPAGFHR